METKNINPLRATFKITPKTEVKLFNQGLIQLAQITATHNVT